MKISEGLNLPGWCVHIPDCGREDLPEFFVEQGFRVGAEIGVEKGRFTEILCSEPSLHIYAIDPWQSYEDYAAQVDAPQDYQNEKYELTKAKLSQYPNCTIIRKTSMDALADFEDRSLDFVYIDGNHSFAYVAQDIFFWSKKIRIGGVISGHDYITIKTHKTFYCDVKPIVNVYTKIARLDKWYVLGREQKILGEKRDRERSWMWFIQK